MHFFIVQASVKCYAQTFWGHVYFCTWISIHEPHIFCQFGSEQSIAPRHTGARLEKMQTFPGIWSKIASKMSFFFTNFQIFLEEKDQNIHLNDIFPLKIAKMSLQNHNFPGMRFPNFTFGPCMHLTNYFFFIKGIRISPP